MNRLRSGIAFILVSWLLACGGGATSTLGLPQGPWRCHFNGSTYMNGVASLQPIAMDGFTVRGDTFTSPQGDGTFVDEGLYVGMRGGGFDNWRGAINVHGDGSPYLVFGGESHRDAEPGRGARFGDVTCEPQR